MPIHPQDKLMPFSQGKDSSQQDILSDTVRNMKSTLTKYSYLYMEDLEDNDVFKKQPYSSIVYNSMKKLYQTNNYQFHTFCVGLHYFQYICRYHKAQIKDGKQLQYAQTCLTLAAIMFEKIQNTSLSNTKSQHTSQILKWLQFSLNVESFISILSVFQSALQFCKRDVSSLRHHINIQIKKILDCLDFLYQNPYRLAVKILKQAMVNNEDNASDSPFQFIVTQEEWRLIPYKEKQKSIFSFNFPQNQKKSKNMFENNFTFPKCSLSSGNLVPFPFKKESQQSYFRPIPFPK